jgi:DNA polymerase
MWRNLEKAAIAAVENKGKRFTVNRTTWYVRGKFLYAELPSGRALAFYGPEVRYEMKWEQKRPVLYHWSVNPLSKKWECAGTYGGRLCENVVSGVARDLMVASQIRTEEAAYIPVISVHDELLNEKRKGQGTLEEFEKLMAALPPWAEGLPVKVKGWTGPRFKK